MKSKVCFSLYFQKGESMWFLNICLPWWRNIFNMESIWWRSYGVRQCLPFIHGGFGQRSLQRSDRNKDRERCAGKWLGNEVPPLHHHLLSVGIGLASPNSHRKGEEGILVRERVPGMPLLHSDGARHFSVWVSRFVCFFFVHGLLLAHDSSLCFGFPVLQLEKASMCIFRQSRALLRPNITSCSQAFGGHAPLFSWKMFWSASAASFTGLVSPILPAVGPAGVISFVSALNSLRNRPYAAINPGREIALTWMQALCRNQSWGTASLYL